MRFTPTDRTVRVALAGSLAVGFSVLLFAVFAVLWLHEENEALEVQDAQSRADRAELRDRSDDLEREVRMLVRQVRRLAGNPGTRPGTYGCQPGFYLAGFAVEPDGVELDCRPLS